MPTSPAFYAALYAPLILILIVNSAIYGRVVIMLGKQRRQRSSYNLEKPPSHREDDKSHRERWHTLQRSLVLFVVISITWLIGLPMLINRSQALQSVFTMFAILQGFLLFGFHCIWSRVGRQAALDLWHKITYPVVGRRGAFELHNGHADHPAVSNRDSLISASELSLTSIELRRASPLGASNSSLNRGQPQQPQVHQMSAMQTKIPLPDPDPQPVYTEINIDEVVARRTSSSAAAPSSLKNGSALRGALKKPRATSSPGHSRAGSRAVTRSNSRKKTKKNVSWGEAIVQEDSEGAGGHVSTSRGGRRAARMKARQRQAGRAVVQYPEGYTLRSTWAGHGVLPDLSALSSTSAVQGLKEPNVMSPTLRHPEKACTNISRQWREFSEVSDVDDFFTVPTSTTYTPPTSCCPHGQRSSHIKRKRAGPARLGPEYPRWCGNPPGF